MIQQLIEMLSGAASRSPAGRPDRLQLAVAALLVQAASMDDTFDDAERAAIEQILARRFALNAEAVKRLLAAAEAASAQSAQLYAFTRIAAKQFGPEERIGLIEMLWEVAYADGMLHPDEDALIRRIAGLIYVSDLDRGAARKRVLQRLNMVSQGN